MDRVRRPQPPHRRGRPVTHRAGEEDPGRLGWVSHAPTRTERHRSSRCTAGRSASRAPRRVVGARGQRAGLRLSRLSATDIRHVWRALGVLDFGLAIRWIEQDEPGGQSEGIPPVPHEIDQSFLALPLRPLADAALARARALGAEHADFRFERVRSAAWRLRDGKPAGSSDRTDLGYAVRVVHGGTWGFASGVDLTPDAAAKVASQAVAMARLSAQVIKAAGSAERVELADEPVHAARTRLGP